MTNKPDGQAAEIVEREFPLYQTVPRFTDRFMRYQRMCGKALGLYASNSASYIYPDGSSVDACYETMTITTTPAGTHSAMLRECMEDAA